MLGLVRNALSPIAEKNAEEIEANRLTETETAKDQERQAKIKAWIDGGRVGRRPHGFADLCEDAIKSAYREAVAETRSAYELGEKGRIPVAIYREYHDAIKKAFSLKLKAINKNTKLYDTIENIVTEFIPELDEETLKANEIEIAIKNASKNADKVAREAIGASERGRIAVESISDYNKAAKNTFRDSLREIKETHGSLPDTMDNLTENYLSLYVVEEKVEVEAKNKLKTTKKKAANESEPVTGEVTSADTDDEADANEAVKAGMTVEKL
jgi:hypothetical protein